MKALTLSLVLATSLMFGACSNNRQAQDQPQQAQVSVTQQESKQPAKGHLCGAITKKGTACQRRVAEGKKYCWQHDGLH